MKINLTKNKYYTFYYSVYFWYEQIKLHLKEFHLGKIYELSL